MSKHRCLAKITWYDIINIYEKHIHQLPCIMFDLIWSDGIVVFVKGSRCKTYPCGVIWNYFQIFHEVSQNRKKYTELCECVWGGGARQFTGYIACMGRGRLIKMITSDFASGRFGLARNKIIDYLLYCRYWTSGLRFCIFGGCKASRYLVI